MKRLTYLLLFILMAGMTYAQQAKYVFFFIGDGMGVNQVNTTEMFRAEMEDGRIGTQKLLFGSFPAAGIATSYSASNSVTDSSAGERLWPPARKPTMAPLAWMSIRKRWRV